MKIYCVGVDILESKSDRNFIQYMTLNSVLISRLGRMIQAGLVYKWHRDEMAKLVQNTGQGTKKNQDGGNTNVLQERVASKPLALDHLQVGLH